MKKLVFLIAMIVTIFVSWTIGYNLAVKDKSIFDILSKSYTNKEIKTGNKTQSESGNKTDNENSKETSKETSNEASKETQNKNTVENKVTEKTEDEIPKDAKMIPVKIYFSNKDGSAVVLETREVPVVNGAKLKAILDAMISGPKDKNLIGTIPDGTNVRSLKIDGDTAFIDFSEEFVKNNPGGSASESMTIYSIVNTVTELSNIKKVQFLINGKKRDSYIQIAIDEPIQRNEKIISR